MRHFHPENVLEPIALVNEDGVEPSLATAPSRGSADVLSAQAGHARGVAGCAEGGHSGRIYFERDTLKCQTFPDRQYHAEGVNIRVGSEVQVLADEILQTRNTEFCS